MLKVIRKEQIVAVNTALRTSENPPTCGFFKYKFCQLFEANEGHVARMGEGRGVYRVLVGKPEGKRPLGRPRRRWEDNIRMDLQEVGLGYEDWIGLAQDRDRWRALVSAVRNFRVP